jgi:hypothetical protein
VSRTIVEVHPHGDDFTAWLYEPGHIANAKQTLPFPYCSADPIPTAFTNGHGRLDEIGAYIMDALRKHPAIEEAIRAQLNAADDVTEPLLVRICPEVENLPWEALYANDGFLALDPRWPARLSQADRGTSSKDFQPPLRVFAVLAADEKLKDTGDLSEWRSLLESLERASFPVTVKAVVAQDAVAEEISRTRSRIVTAEATQTASTDALVEEIKTYRPQILHFFCHGVDKGGPSLQLSTRLSLIEAGKPIFLGPVLIQQTLTDHLWLVTLNCCKSAKGGGFGSLAYTLMERGAPTVAGMREPVSVTEANEFTKIFYRELVAALADTLAQQSDVEFDWTRLLYRPRMAVGESEAKQRHEEWPSTAASGRAWTLPALYLGCRFYRLNGRPTAGDARPTGVVTSRLPEVLLALLSGARRGAGPTLTDEERVNLEVQLQVLRGLVEQDLGAPPDALDAYKSRITELEKELYGPSAGDGAGT